MTIKNASTGEYIISATNEKMLASPILAPGMGRGVNWFSTMNIIRLSAVKRAIVANFFVAKVRPFIIKLPPILHKM
jgi:hypothetical protein